MRLECTFDQFRRDRALFLWTAHTRPDMACIANRAAQATDQTFTKKHVKELNQSVKMARSSPELSLGFPKSGGGLYLRAYVDVSYGIMNDLSLKMGYTVLLCDELAGCHVLDFANKKSIRVVRSVMGAKTLAFLKAFDAVYSISVDMTYLLNMPLPIVMFTEARQIFDAITRRLRTTEKRLAIEMAVARHSY